MLRFVPRIAAVLLLVVAGTLAPAAAEDRAFKASGEGFVNNSEMLGSGQATHLGPTFLELSFGYDLSSGRFRPDGASLTSANGDVLTFDFDAVDDYRFDMETGVVSRTVTFTGGTGRFQDATGSADVMIVFDPGTAYQTFTFLIDGSIDY